MNNNSQAVFIGFVDDTTDDGDEIFNTSYVESSLAFADCHSKSLSDIHAPIIPQNTLRPSSLAFKSDFFLCVSIWV